MNIFTETWWSTTIGREKSVTIVLPPGYRPTGRPFPVLYLLHGFGGNRRTWLSQCPDLGVHLDAGRMIAVLPESGRSWLINDVRGRRYEDYLVHEVVSYMDAHYNTVASADGRAMAGFSMGGASALFHALRHADLFSVIGSHSGAFEAPLRDGDPYHALRADPAMLMPTAGEHERVWGRLGSEVRRAYDPYRLIAARDRSASLHAYLDVGLDDYDRMITMNRNVRAALTAHDVAHEYGERPGGHDWRFVNAGLPRLFGFLRDRVADC